MSKKDKPKKQKSLKKIITITVLIAIILLIETISVFLIGMDYVKKKASHWHAEVKIPDGLQLTIEKDVSVFVLTQDSVTNETVASDVVISEGEKISPIWIRDSSLTFYYEKTGERHTISSDSIKEQDLLKDLNSDADERTISERNDIILNGFLISIAISLCVLIAGIFISVRLMKKQKNKLLILIHVVIIVVIGILLVNSFMFLERG